MLPWEGGVLEHVARPFFQIALFCFICLDNSVENWAFIAWNLLDCKREISPFFVCVTTLVKYSYMKVIWKLYGHKMFEKFREVVSPKKRRKKKMFEHKWLQIKLLIFKTLWFYLWKRKIKNQQTIKTALFHWKQWTYWRISFHKAQCCMITLMKRSIQANMNGWKEGMILTTRIKTIKKTRHERILMWREKSSWMHGAKKKRLQKTKSCCAFKRVYNLIYMFENQTHVRK